MPFRELRRRTADDADTVEDGADVAVPDTVGEV
jgi:hypothetical protein